ncbi:MAG: hypothetical protein ABI661_12630, partial [Gammaproteobacteria bacterium]
TANTPLAAQSITDALLARYGQFEVTSQQSKLITGGPKTKAYHVCMNEGEFALPLRVMHDGKETIVEPGECALIDAKSIKLAASGELNRNMTLIGTRGNVRTADSLRKYTTKVQAREVPAPSPEEAEVMGAVH